MKSWNRKGLRCKKMNRRGQDGQRVSLREGRIQKQKEHAMSSAD